jgi:uncharacterized protein (TIGR02271 family)
MERNDEEILNPDEREEIVVPLLEEELAAGTKEVKTGAVRVEKHVDKTLRRVVMPLVHDDVEVRRVAVNRVIAEVPKVRKKGGVIIVPVVEEQMVISKRLVLKEEIHLTRRRTRERVVKEVELERERADIRRLDAAGNELQPRRRRVVG